ncbi:hypothetical protein BpOF4_07785 [Alkalihalophilus pseudofirmus OF4]|uniref:Uncharacterized protein n=2 Tax=Alkalihalophilus pseudofirmus TaxID=79885 RepID=D3FQE3_ALKPO|nr:hypothetical protein [Alkalihalophilus pseudofirmus]ADC49615.1 hypothetical protein BpOF4_07785 [Alkalihalophilus pseudofirmus OF4]MDV2887386.1 hypothetical protein [Alkalihalophilus pseudofirmus]WEG16953.1 hypothetical protein PQ478_21005 [Alkalihalophilus pseudofirmus]
MQLLLERLFSLCLLLSLLLALTMVVSQLIGFMIGNGELVIQSRDILKQPTIIFAAIFSGIAFILGYFPAYQEQNNS